MDFKVGKSYGWGNWGIYALMIDRSADASRLNRIVYAIVNKDVIGAPDAMRSDLNETQNYGLGDKISLPLLVIFSLERERNLIWINLAISSWKSGCPLGPGSPGLA